MSSIGCGITLPPAGTIFIVSLGDLPAWLPAWCRDHLGGEPVDVLFQLQQLSTVIGLRMADGTDVVVKARPDDGRGLRSGHCTNRFSCRL